MVTQLTDADFNEKVTKASGPVAVDFWAEWSGSSRAATLFLDAAAESLSGRAQVMRLNVDDANRTAMANAIRTVPTTVLFADGKPKASTTQRFQSDAEFTAWVESAL